MEIKILCTCGTKFKFEVEPVHGRMPMPVNCPNCGADATAQANAVIESTLGTAPAPPTAVPLPAAPAGLRISPPTVPAAAPMAGVAAGGPPPPTPPPMRPRPLPPQKKKGLRVGR